MLHDVLSALVLFAVGGAIVGGLAGYLLGRIVWENWRRLWPFQFRGFWRRVWTR